MATLGETPGAGSWPAIMAPREVREWRTARPRRRVSIRDASRSTFACSDADAGLMPTAAASSTVPSGSPSAQHCCPGRAEQRGQAVGGGRADRPTRSGTKQEAERTVSTPSYCARTEASPARCYARSRRTGRGDPRRAVTVRRGLVQGAQDADVPCPASCSECSLPQLSSSWTCLSRAASDAAVVRERVCGSSVHAGLTRRHASWPRQVHPAERWRSRRQG